MSDIEWYLQSNGTRSGPYSAQQVVEMFEKGVIPGTTMATATRMNGDWVTVSDLAEAFQELRGPQSSSLGKGSQFQAPPRPVEQIEASKLIDLSALRGQSETMDSLFAALQAIKEKNAQKLASHAHASAATDNWGKVSRPSETPSRMSFYATILLLLVVLGYVSTKLFGPKDEKFEKTAKNSEPVKIIFRENESPKEASPSRGSLMSAGGSPGERAAAAKTTPPIRLIPGGGAQRDTRPPTRSALDSGRARPNDDHGNESSHTDEIYSADQGWETVPGGENGEIPRPQIAPGQPINPGFQAEPGYPPQPGADTPQGYISDPAYLNQPNAPGQVPPMGIPQPQNPDGMQQ